MAAGSNTSGATNYTLLGCASSDTPEAQGAKLVGYIILMLLSVLGNGLVLAIIYRNPNMRNTTNFFIANMAISDFIVPLYVAPSNIVDIVTGTHRRWLVHGAVGLALCKLMSYLLDVSTAVSIMSLVAMAMDRYYAVAHPLKANFTKRARACVIPLIWVIAGAVHAPHFYTFHLHEENNITHCLSTWEPAFDNIPTTKRYQMTLFVAFYIVPLILITLLYTQTLRRLKNRVIPGDILPERRRREDATTRGILKMAITVVVAFGLCWLPVHVLILCLFYKWNWALPCHLYGLWFVGFYLGYFNSILNPCIYFLYNKNYRAGFRGIFGELRCTKGRESGIGHGLTVDRSMEIIRGTELSNMESRYAA